MSEDRSYAPPVFKRRRLDGSGRSTPRAEHASTPGPDVPQPTDEDTKALDRDWYAGDEFGGHVFGDDMHNPFGHDYSAWEKEHQEAVKAEKMSSRYDARREQRNRDNDAWETNRMLVSGVAQRRDMAADFDDDEATRVHLLVHELRPPFLDGRTIFTKQLEPVPAVRDYQSDMAVFSRKGSKVVKEARQQRERQRQAQEATSMKGTALGNLMGVKEEEGDSAMAIAGEEDAVRKPDGETSNKFSDHMKKKAEGGSDFSRTKTLQEQRQYLPAFAVREDLMRVIRENQVIVVVGETGSGKTTQLTQFLYEEGYGDSGMIGCTQPRRVAAMSVAKRVAEEMDVKLGSTVGYAIRFEDCTSKETVIKYMTDGVLLRESLNEPDLDKYSCIIMDEAHEHFTIPGRTFPVDTMFHRSPVEDYVDQAVQQVLSIHVSMDQGDILVFMTGQEDIEVTCELVQKRLDALNDPPKLSILPIYSQMPADLQAKIFDRAAPGRRAGRTGPGKAFRLFTEKAFKEELYLQTIPEIQRTNLSNTVLMLKSLGVKDLLDFDFMDPPPQDTITTSMFDLWALGALNNLGELTKLGAKMSAFPMDPSLSKLLITAEEYGCSEEMITIVSMLCTPAWSPTACGRWVHQALPAPQLRCGAPRNRDHCSTYKMQKMQMLAAAWTGRIRSAICSGYYHQGRKYKGSGEYINLRTNLGVQLHPTSALYAGHPPDYIVYHESSRPGEKGYSMRDKRITETEFNRKMEIETQMADDRRRQQEQMAAEQERDSRKKTLSGPVKKVVTQGAVKKPVIKRKGRNFRIPNGL
ncbi:pre-mRNA-splicing factor ATP-dependent RNA helicase prp16, partial [Verticillium dahliae]